MKNILLLFLFISTSLFAQRGERIKAFKTAHITEALSLTPAEAEKFWPVYNAFEEKMEELRKKERQEIFRVVKENLDRISDAEAETLIDKGFNYKAKELAYHKELHTNLKGIISAKKMLRLRRAEEEFKRKLLEMMKNRRRKGK